MKLPCKIGEKFFHKGIFYVLTGVGIDPQGIPDYVFAIRPYYFSEKYKSLWWYGYENRTKIFSLNELSVFVETGLDKYRNNFCGYFLNDKTGKVEADFVNPEKFYKHFRCEEQLQYKQIRIESCRFELSFEKEQ